MSSKTTVLPGKARRESGKTGRFLPSEPLHMTTRRAKRTGRVSDGSNNDSNDGEESPQGSLDDVAPTTSRSLGSQISDKGRRISVNSTNGAADVRFTFEPRSSDRKRRRSTETKPESPEAQSESPSRKRKRSSPTPLDTRNASEEVYTPSANTLSNPYGRTLDQDVRPEDVTSREVSEASSPLNEHHAAGYINITQSTEFTPAASEAVSPASEPFDDADISPTKDAVMTGIAPDADADEQDDVDDADDLADVDDADDADDANDVEDGDENSNAYNGARQKRTQKRRRADHPDPSIEATMRRQLQLKSAFRAITRALKPVLAEIALKTVEEIQAKPDLHEQVPEFTGTDEYYGIQELLDQTFQKRKNRIMAQARWNRLHLQRTLEAEQKVREEKCRLLIEDLRDLEFDRLEHKSLSIARKAQLTEEESSYETQDEDDDVLLKPKATTHRYVRTQAIDGQYDSRSRQALAAEQASNELAARVRMTDMLRELSEEDQREVFGSFTTMNPAAREAANARLASIHTTIVLADAAAQVEEIANRPIIPVIRNEEATGLQLLGDLASRPSIRAVEPPKIPDQIRRHNPFAGGVSAAGMQMPPPPPVRPTVAPEPSLDDTPSRQAGMPVSIPHDPFANATMPLRKSSLPASRSGHPLLSPRSSAPRAGTLPPLISAIEAESLRRPLPSQHTRGSSFDRLFHRLDPMRSGLQPRDAPPWDNYQRPEDKIKHSRNISTGDRSVHEWSHGGPLRIERVEQTEPERRPQPQASRLSHPETAKEQPPKKDSPSDVLLHTSKAKQWESAASPGAVEPPRPQEKPALESHKDAALETPVVKPRSRASSIKSQSTARDFTPDATNAGTGESAQFHQRQQKGSMSTWSLKTNKKERNGSSRKSWKEQLGGNGRRTSQGSPNTEGKPSIHRFRLNTSVEATTPTTTWPAPNPQYMMDYHHIPFAGYPPAWYPGVGPPPPPGYPYMHGFNPYYEHRNSFPPPPPPPPGTGPPAGQQHPNWPPHPHGPSHYGMPQSTPTPGGAPQHPPPPPPGVSPADWQHHQSIYGNGAPLNPVRDPRGTMPPVTASYPPQQYGGQPLAPASAAPPPPPPNPNLDPRLSFAGPGSGPATPGQSGQQHLPAFAQMRDGEGGNGGAGGSGSGGKGRSGSGNGGSRRKRAQSDVPGQARFQHWKPRQ